MSLFDKAKAVPVKVTRTNAPTRPVEEDKVRPAVGKAVAAKKASAAAGKAAPTKKSIVGGKAAKHAKAVKAVKAERAAKVTKLPAQEVRTRNSAGAAGARAPATTEVADGKKVKAASTGRRGRTGSYTENQKIRVLVKENPKREGSKAYDVFETLMKCKTVGEFYKAGYGATNLNYNEQHGFIEVV